MSNKLIKIEKFRAARIYNITNTSTLSANNAKSFKISKKFLLSIVVIFLTIMLVIFANETNAAGTSSSATNSAVMPEQQVGTKKNIETNANASQKFISILDKTTTYEALFVQKIKTAKVDKIDTTKGKMYSKKPNLFRWEVTTPSHGLIISNGKNLWDYDKELEQITIQKINANDINATPFFLSGNVKQLQSDYIIEVATCKTYNLTNSEVCFKLIPKKDDMSFQYLILGFKEDILRDMVMLDQLGQTTDIEFLNPIVNKDINNSLFKLDIPDGVDVLKNS